MENFGPYVYEYWSSVLLEDYSLSLHHIVQKMVDSGLFRFLFKSFGMSHEAAALQWRVYRDVTSRNRGDARSQGCRISDVCRILYCDAEQLPIGMIYKMLMMLVWMWMLHQRSLKK